MNKYVRLSLMVAAIALFGCQKSQLPTLTPTESLPRSENTVEPAKIETYQDVRNLDLSTLNINPDRSLIETLWFNESTTWPEPIEHLAKAILEQGKNPGLGIKKLHQQGITGKGVNVAIIDQNLVLDHPEFSGKIVKYFDTGTNQKASQGSMHGPAVTSLLVGENIGAAPDANVYYVAAPSWALDARYYAQALDWIVNENNNLSGGDKIRVVSVSAAPSGPGTPFVKNNDVWDEAYRRATEAGILVLDCTANRGITAPCHFDLDDPDNLEKCIPGWPDADIPPMPDRIYIPTSFRTTAEEYDEGEYSYQYNGRGGISWSIPYLSGVLALGWQVRPELTGAELLEMIYKSAYITPEGLKIINPAAFIAMLAR